tara:strand:+ start:862 stop:1311 length:450 start_codon:yes stop_codon:yes gene_type:complete
MKMTITTSASSPERNEEMLDMCFSDYHKEVYGFRPRNATWDYYVCLSQAEFNEELAQMEAQNEAQFLEARADEAEDVADFKEQVEDAIRIGAGDETTALRWITSEEEFYSGQCVEHFVWQRGILFTTYGRNLVEKLLNVVTFKEFQKYG